MADDGYLLLGVFQEYQKRIEAHFNATDARIVADEKLRVRENELLAQQVVTAKSAIDIRLEGMNELRAQINKERGLYLEAALFDAKYEAIIERLNRMDLKVANWEGRFWMLGAGITSMVIVIQVLMNWYRK